MMAAVRWNRRERGERGNGGWERRALQFVGILSEDRRTACSVVIGELKCV